MDSFEFCQKVNGQTLDGSSPFGTPECFQRPGCFTYIPPPPKHPVRKCQPPCHPPPKIVQTYHTPKGRNYVNVNYDRKYCPGPCTRPCCLHNCVSSRDRGPPCAYDDPCVAHCYNHPVGMKPSGRYPPDIYRGPLSRNL